MWSMGIWHNGKHGTYGTMENMVHTNGTMEKMAHTNGTYGTMANMVHTNGTYGTTASSNVVFKIYDALYRSH